MIGLREPSAQLRDRRPRAVGKQLVDHELQELPVLTRPGDRLGREVVGVGWLWSHGLHSAGGRGRHSLRYPAIQDLYAPIKGRAVL